MNMSCHPILGGMEEDPTKIKDQCIYGMNECVLPRLLKRDSVDEYIDTCVKCFSSANETNPGDCPPVFDYWTCWDATKAGAKAIRICPQNFKYFNYFNHPNRIYKTCLANGTWNDFIDYSVCLEKEKYFAFQLFVRSLNITGLLISATSLIISLLIFYNFRSLLKCRRIRIHVQLFISYIMTDLASVFWELYIMDMQNSYPILQENPGWCQCFQVLLQFFIMSNYLWMFCEGLNLFVSLVVVFIDEKYYMRLFYSIGWALSFVIVIIYALFRRIYSDANNLSECWKNYSTFERIIRIPITISLIIDCFFFICIIKIICGKLNHNSDMKTPLRSAFILVTLLGIQHVLFMHKDPEETTPIFYYFHYLMQTTTSAFQGFAVACIFCFGNYDVQCALKSNLEKVKSQTYFSVFGKSYFQALSLRQKLVPSISTTATSGIHNHAVTSSTADV